MRIIGLMVFILMCQSVLSQNIIRGEVRNSENALLPYTSISLKSETSASIVAYTYSDDAGRYELQINQTGTFQLVFSALNHELLTIIIDLKNGKNTVIQNVNLNYKPIELGEVIIKNEGAITTKKDTITFNAKSFTTGNEKVVEDLLRKIPGVTVTANGTIKVGDQEIEKIMIDGDDFFEKGYKLLSKNMPVNPVDKVELYKNYSNNKHLKGVEHSDRIALNLKLKDDVKREWFGNMQLGYGIISENRYVLHSNLMNFGKRSKYYFLTNLNNIGEDAVGDLTDLMNSPTTAPGNLGNYQNLQELLSINGDRPELNSKRVNLNNNEMVCLNNIYTISPGFKFKVLSFLNSDEENFYINRTQFYDAENVAFTNYENTVTRKRNMTGFGKINLDYDFSPTKSLSYTGKISFSEIKGKSNILFNLTDLNEALESKSKKTDHKLVYSNKVNESSVLLITGRYIESYNDQNYLTDEFLYEELFGTGGEKIDQNVENNMQYAGAEAHYMNKDKNGNLFEVQFGNQFRKDMLDSTFKIENFSNSLFPSLYQNDFDYVNNDLFLIPKYRYNIKKVTFSGQTDFHQMLNRINDFDLKKSQNIFFITPKIVIDWAMNDKQRFQGTYKFSKTNAELFNTYSNYIYTGFRSFAKGTGEFNQIESSFVNITHLYSNWETRFFSNTSLSFTQNYDFFSTNSLVSTNYIQSEKIIIRNRELTKFTTNIDKFIKPVSSNFNFSVEASKSNYKNVVNDSDLREIKYQALSCGFELRSAFKGFFNYHLGFKRNYTKITSNVTNSNTNDVSFFDLFFKVSKTLNWQIQTERYYFSALSKQYKIYNFLDVEANYTVKKNNMKLSLVGNNLFNNKTFRNYLISDILVSKTEYRIQPRYVLLKIEFGI